MDNRQAKRILATYRPGIDDDEPQMADALAQAKHDPELSRWLERQTAADSSVRTKLRNAPMPVGLKTRILANRPAETPAGVWWKRRSIWIAAATAILAIEFFIYWPHFRPANAFAAYRAGMVQYVAAGYKMDLRTENLDALRQAFIQSGWPSDYVVPLGLKQLMVEGGCQSRWRNHKVSLLCLEAKDHDVWLLVIERDDVWGAPPKKPVFAKEGGIATASWTSGHLTYILATAGDEVELKSLL